MAGSTKLFQQAGSPLIQGRSRYARSFWRDWIAAWVSAVAAIYVFLAVTTLLDPTRPYLTSAEAVFMWLALPVAGVVVALPVSAVGVWIGRVIGLRIAWLVGAVPGAVLGVLAMGYSWRATSLFFG